MTTPALQRLRERFPQASITILADEKVAELWQDHRSVNSVLTFKRSDGPWSVAPRLRGYNFDAALIFPNSPRAALEPWLAGIPNRIGYAGHWRRWLLTHRVEHASGQLRPRRRGVREIKRLVRDESAPGPEQGTIRYTHQIHDYLGLAAALDANPSPVPPRLEVKSQEIESAITSLRELLPAGQSNRTGQSPVWLGVNASAAYGPAKCWPLERFAAVTRLVSEKMPNCVWLHVGSRTDWVLGQRLADRAAGSFVNLAGKTSLRQLMGVLCLCRVLLSNDSGPMHVAAALGTPVVVPFGSTSPELTGPGQPGDAANHLLRGEAQCAPCFRRTCPIDFRCMTSISVEQVAGAILESLKASF